MAVYVKVHGYEITEEQDPDRVIGWLKAHFPTLLNLLFLDDEVVSTILFDDTVPHTVSWHIAVLAKNGNKIAKEICQVLNLLSSEHCKHALEAGI